MRARALDLPLTLLIAWGCDGAPLASSGLPDGDRADVSSPSDASVLAVDAGSSDAGEIDRSLAGTSLEGIRVDWAEPLELCDLWREGASLEEALSQKAHLTLQPERRGLGRGELEAARLSGLLRRGATAERQWAIDGGRRADRVEWRLEGPPEDTQLFARLEHDLGGGNILSEQLVVRRSAGDRRPVRFTTEGERGFRPEVSFWLRRGSESPGAFLAPCRGFVGPEPAIEVLAAQTATQTVILLRHLWTEQQAEGSRPIFLERAEVMFQGLAEQEARGPLTLFYAAEHHNFDEHSRIDFTEDVVAREMTLEPWMRGESPARERVIERVDVLANSFEDAPEVAVQILDTTAGTRTTHRLTPLARFWSRVDAVDLARRFATPACPSPEVEGVMVYAYRSIGLTRLQIVRCPGAVLAAVPVTSFTEPALVGRTITGLLQDASGVQIPLGARTLVLRARGGGYDFRVLDAAGVELEAGFGGPAPIDAPPAVDEVWRGESASGDVVVEHTTRLAGFGGLTNVLAAVAFELRFARRTHRVEALDRLDFHWTHHNWDDSFDAETDELRLRWWTTPGDGTELLSHFVRAIRKSDGALVLPDTRVQRAP